MVLGLKLFFFYSSTIVFDNFCFTLVLVFIILSVTSTINISSLKFKLTIISFHLCVKVTASIKKVKGGLKAPNEAW